MKKTIIFAAPVQTRSGYGARSRDLIRQVIKNDNYDVKILPTRWGMTPLTALNDTVDYDLISRFVAPQNVGQPDIWVQITIPNEFQKQGKVNIGITAGIESNLTPIDWIEGINRMDLVLVSSKHSKDVFESTEVQRSNEYGQITETVKVNTPIDVLFEGVDVSVYGKDNVEQTAANKIKNLLKDVVPKRNFLVVGHWLQGVLFEDRKNIGANIAAFAKAFAEERNIGLILKSSVIGYSILEREQLLTRIREAVSSQGVDIDKLHIHLIYEDLTDIEMNALYQNPKVSYMVSLTCGEGYGRPLAEFLTAGKPIVASGWSGHLDFVKDEYNLLVRGEIKNIHESAQNKWFLPQSQWFKASIEDASKKMFLVKNSQKYLEKSKNNINFVENITVERMGDVFESQLEPYAEKVPTAVKLVLPKLRKI